MEGEGVEFVTNAHIGGSISFDDMQREFQAVVLAMGAEHPRDLKSPGAN